MDGKDTMRAYKLTYQCWQSMKDRCRNPNSRQFKNYGARGISICGRWLESFQNFLDDMGLKPDGFSFDRINNDGDYSPGNCRWATKREQNTNRRGNRLVTFMGRTQTLTEWAQECGVNDRTAFRRLRKGFPMSVILHRGPIRVGQTYLVEVNRDGI